MPGSEGSTRAWCVAVVVWIAALGAFELVAREHGFPVSREGPSAISIHRTVEEIQPDDLVLIGSSEIAAGVDLAILSATLHRPVRMLTAWGATSVPLLDYLLQQRPDFRGQVILSLTFANFTKRATGYERQLRTMLDAASSVSPAQLASEAMTDWFADRFVFRNPQLEPEPEYLGEILLRIDNQGVTPDGELVAAVPSAAKLHYLQAGWEHVTFAADPEGTDRRRAQVRRGFAELRARGGGAMLLYVPSVGSRQPIEDRFPRQETWDRFAAESGAPALRVEDVPELKAAFHPLDGIHLEVDSRQVFTRALAKVLVENFGLAR